MQIELSEIELDKLRSFFEKNEALFISNERYSDVLKKIREACYIASWTPKVERILNNPDYFNNLGE